MEKKFSYEIEEKIALLSVSGDYTLELNRVSFNGYPAKYDVRRWYVDIPLKGITLTDFEAENLYKALAEKFG